MGRALALTLAVGIGGGCSLVVGSGSGKDSVDAAAPADAAADAHVFGDCATEGERSCQESSIAECSGGSLVAIEQCALACSSIGVAHCSSFEPSNLSATDFADAVGELVVPKGEIVTIDTDTFTVTNQPPGGAPRIQTQAGALALAVFRYTNIQIDGRVEITGSRLFALVSAGDVSVSGQVELTAGIDFDCGLATPQPMGRPGGTGGGHGSLGGLGGEATGTMSELSGSAELRPLVPGCRGTRGGGSSGSMGGIAGGGLEIAAADTITIAGNLCASGFGGSSAVLAGGGGGGSGGGILLEAPSIALVAGGELATNGGGGAGGGSTAGPGGISGQHGCTPKMAPKGGNGDTGSVSGVVPGKGGDGAIASETGGTGDSGFMGGGGGGGGGVGRIRLNSASGAESLDNASTSGVLSQGTLTPVD